LGKVLSETESALGCFLSKSLPVLRLRKRKEFLVVQKGEKRRGKHFLLEMRRRSFNGMVEVYLPPRIGFTISRKNGNAVKRNRIRRRLREAVRLGVQDCLVPGYDYVIVARPDILTLPFAELIVELRQRIGGDAVKRESKES